MSFVLLDVYVLNGLDYCIETVYRDLLIFMCSSVDFDQRALIGADGLIMVYASCNVMFSIWIKFNYSNYNNIYTGLKVCNRISTKDNKIHTTIIGCGKCSLCSP